MITLHRPLTGQECFCLEDFIEGVGEAGRLTVIHPNEHGWLHPMHLDCCIQALERKPQCPYCGIPLDLRKIHHFKHQQILRLLLGKSNNEFRKLKSKATARTKARSAILQTRSEEAFRVLRLYDEQSDLTLISRITFKNFCSKKIEAEYQSTQEKLKKELTRIQDKNQNRDFTLSTADSISKLIDLSTNISKINEELNKLAAARHAISRRLKFHIVLVALIILAIPLIAIDNPKSHPWTLGIYDQSEDFYRCRRKKAIPIIALSILATFGAKWGYRWNQQLKEMDLRFQRLSHSQFS